MKILFVNENIGGHANVHAHLRTALADHREVSADFVDVPSPSLLRRLAGARVPGLARADLDYQSVRAQLALSQWVRRHVWDRARRADVLHVYTGNAALRLPGLLSAMPSVVATDATNATNAYRLPGRHPTRFTPATVRVAQRFERRVYDAATLVVANTGWIADSLREDYDVAEDKLRVVPYGILAPDFGDGAAPGTDVAGSSLPQVVFVGRQLERKGALRLYRLHQAHLADLCELVIVTPPDVSVPPGRNVRAVHDVTVGSNRLWEVLRQAAVFAFPSEIDQAPNVVIEAFAAGLPVVGATVSAMPEMVPPDCGRLVAPDDDAALVRVLRELVDQPRLRQQLGAASRRRFVRQYDAVTSTDRLIEVLHEARDRYARGGGHGVPRCAQETDQ